jgi:hypothetical protein
MEFRLGAPATGPSDLLRPMIFADNNGQAQYLFLGTRLARGYMNPGAADCMSRHQENQ